MSKTVQKITLSASRDIPFNKLVLSQSNVRRVKAGISIEQLAESIAQRTLLQSLSVRPVLDAEGLETGMYEVPAGGRRFQALQLLVQQKRLAKTAPVPCVVRLDGLAEDDSLAENDQRIGLHPLDQLRAFLALRALGLDEAEIAARHFVSAEVVRQRLRLASVSPKLLDLYAEDGISLQQLMAFTISDDHERQEQVWDTISRGYNRDPYMIRRALTETTVEADDARAVFVGIDAYEQAGGVVLRDLFQQDGGGWLQDVALLDRLATGKLKAAAEGIAAEGWKWVEVAIDLPYGHHRGTRHLRSTVTSLTPEEGATYAALDDERDEIYSAHRHEAEMPEEILRRLREIDGILDEFDNRPERFDPAEVRIAGAFVTIDGDGKLFVDRGHVRPEDEPLDDAEPARPVSRGVAAPDATPENGQGSIQRAVITIGGGLEAQCDRRWDFGHEKEQSGNNCRWCRVFAIKAGLGSDAADGGAVDLEETGEFGSTASGPKHVEDFCRLLRQKLEATAAQATLGPRSLQAGVSPLTDHGALELREGAKHLHHHAPGRRHGLDRLGQRTGKPASAASIFSRMRSRSLSERERRSSFQTTRPSPGRRRLSTRCNSDRSQRLPEARSSKISLHPAASRALI